eukprot:TRINITY_DN19592_c0_g4_i2.p1 TRINITY_DN19592_c0_g4~~TRINITY_DN19592_c0_g4_i2.p1  ORF type:complete len:152 (+),score=20.67 TRINITY_DN19592_c0_g4_i2:56-511(+)
MQLAITKLAVATSLLLVATSEKLILNAAGLSHIKQQQSPEHYTLKWVAYENESFNHSGEVLYTGDPNLVFYIGNFRYPGDGCAASTDADVAIAPLEVKWKAEYCERLHTLNGTVVIRRNDTKAIVGAANCCNNQGRLLGASGTGAVLSSSV